MRKVILIAALFGLGACTNGSMGILTAPSGWFGGGDDAANEAVVMEMTEDAMAETATAEAAMDAGS